MVAEVILVSATAVAKLRMIIQISPGRHAGRQLRIHETHTLAPPAGDYAGIRQKSVHIGVRRRRIGKSRERATCRFSADKLPAYEHLWPFVPRPCIVACSRYSGGNMSGLAIMPKRYQAWAG